MVKETICPENADGQDSAASGLSGLRTVALDSTAQAYRSIERLYGSAGDDFSERVNLKDALYHAGAAMVNVAIVGTADEDDLHDELESYGMEDLLLP